MRFWSYLNYLQDRRTVQRTNAKRAKTCIATHVCTNPIGKTLLMAVLGRPKNTRCFQNAQQAVLFIKQKIVWSDTKTFRQWFTTVCSKFIQKYTTRSAALKLDNCTLHGANLEEPRGRIIVFAFLPDSISVNKAIDMGIIQAWKVYERELLLQKFPKP